MSSSQKTKFNIEEWFERFIKYVSKKTANCRDSEGLTKWCNTFWKAHEGLKIGHVTFYDYVRKRSEKIEEATYLNTLEKVQVLFVLGRPMSSTFEKRLLENGCSIELDIRRRIHDFSSSDGKFKRSGDQNSKHVLWKQITRNDQPNNSLIQNSPTTSTRESTENENGVGGTDGPSTSAIKGPARNELSIQQKQLEHAREQEKERQVERIREAEESRAQDRQQEQAEVRGSISNPRRRQEPAPTEAKRAKPSEIQSSSSAIPRVDSEAYGLSNQAQERTGSRTASQPESLVTDRQSSGAFSTSAINDVSLSIPRVGSGLSNAPAPQPSREATSSTSQIQMINVAQLARQLETLAETFEFSNLKRRASRIRKSVEKQNKTITLDTLSIYIFGILTNAKLKKVQQFQGDSIKILTFFKRLRNTLIIPLGEKTMKEVLEVLDRKIKKLDINKDQSVLPKKRVRTFIKFLLDIFIKN